MQIKRKCVLLVLALFYLLLMTGCKRQLKNSNEDSDRQQEVSLENDEDQLKEKTHPVEEEETVDVSEVLQEMNQQENEYFKIENAVYNSQNSFNKKVLEQLGQESVKTVYTKKYQEAVDQVINKLKEKQSYTLESPLFLQDPYGTIHNGMYLYYISEEPCQVNYTVYVDHDAIPAFHGTLSANHELGTKQEGLIVGLMAGMKNYLVLTETDESNETIRTQVWCIDFTSLGVTKQVLFTEEAMDITDATTDAMYMLLTDETSDEPSIRFLDEANVKRFEIELQQATNLEVEVTNQGLIFPKDANTLVVMNQFGKIVQFLSLGEYQYKKGIVYNETTNSIYMIAGRGTPKETSDVIIAVDIDTAECTKIFDFVVIAEQTGIEISFESIDVYKDDQILVNSEETSSIFCFDLFEKVNELKYIISDGLVWEGTYLEEYVYQGIGSFEPLRNQQQINVDTNDRRLIEGQYYVTMLNQLEDKTVYYKVFVDENTKTFTLANMEEIKDNPLDRYQLDFEESPYDQVETFDFSALLGKSISQID